MMFPIDLSGKKALVCGATQGIGRAIALSFAQLGADVCLCARNPEKLQETLHALPRTAQQQHHYIVADFNQPEALKQALQAHLATNPVVHILVNNTGGPAPGTALEATTDDFIAAFQAHLVCGQHLVQACAPAMKAAGYGRIINIISTSVKQPIPGLGVSNTIRGAVASWAKTLSRELAPAGITVNNILPGFTKTGRLDALIQKRAADAGMKADAYAQQMMEQIPAKRFATAEEVAAAAVFLASPAAAYINGTNIPVDGGNTACL